MKNYTVYYFRFYNRKGQQEEYSVVKNCAIKANSEEDALLRFKARRQGTLRCEVIEAIQTV